MTAKIDLIAKLTALMPECAREIIKIMREYDVQTAQVYDRSNLPRRVEAFLAAKRIDGCRPKTIKGYRERLKLFMTQCSKPVQQITTDDLREYLAYLVDERHLMDNSVQAHINTLRSFFSWLVDEDNIRKSPMRKIKSLKIDKLRSRHPLTAEQLELVRDGQQPAVEIIALRAGNIEHRLRRSRTSPIDFIFADHGAGHGDTERHCQQQQLFAARKGSFFLHPVFLALHQRGCLA